jgi:hypothetical protein
MNNNYFQRKSEGIFIFKGALSTEETSSGLYSFAREVKLSSHDNLLYGVDTISMAREVQESLGLLQFNLGKNLKILDVQHDSEKQKGYIFYEIEPGIQSRSHRKSKKRERVLFIVAIDKQFFIKTATRNNFPVITIGYPLDDSQETKVHWSFQIVK